MKKFLNSAFTMAEAILVMTILGIIATIMISTLKPAEFKEKGMRVMAKKVLSEIDVATTQILMNNTADGTFDTLYEAGTSNLFNTQEDMIIITPKLANLYKAYLSTLRKTPELPKQQFSWFLLKDGATIGINFEGVPVEGLSIFPGEDVPTNTTFRYGSIFFDINDNEPPNILGKDQFVLPLDKHGIKYAD